MLTEEHHYQVYGYLHFLKSLALSGEATVSFYFNSHSRETICLKQLGEEYRCDGGKVGSSLGVRDYGALLINRIGRRGYKINFQVVMLLWDFK